MTPLESITMHLVAISLSLLIVASIVLCHYLVRGERVGGDGRVASGWSPRTGQPESWPPPTAPPSEPADGRGVASASRREVAEPPTPKPPPGFCAPGRTSTGRPLWRLAELPQRQSLEELT